MRLLHSLQAFLVDKYIHLESSQFPIDISKQVMANLARLTNARRKPLGEDSLYTFEVVKQEAKNKGVQAAVAAALKASLRLIQRICFIPLFDLLESLERVAQGRQIISFYCRAHQLVDWDA
jgi:hypothetical protein